MGAFHGAPDRVGPESVFALPECLTSQTFHSFTGGDQGNALNLLEGQHMSLVAGDDEVNLSGNGCSQNPIVRRIGR